MKKLHKKLLLNGRSTTHMTEETIHEFIKGLNVNDSVKASIGPMIEKINRSIEKQEELRDDLIDTAASVKKSTTGLISDKKALDALVKENQKRLQQISKEYEKDVKGTLQNLADSIGETSKDITGLTKQIGRFPTPREVEDQYGRP